MALHSDIQSGEKSACVISRDLNSQDGAHLWLWKWTVKGFGGQLFFGGVGVWPGSVCFSLAVLRRGGGEPSQMDTRRNPSELSSCNQFKCCPLHRSFCPADRYESGQYFQVQTVSITHPKE